MRVLAPSEAVFQLRLFYPFVPPRPNATYNALVLLAMRPMRPSTLQPRRTHENPPSLPYGIHHAQRRTRMPRRPPLGLRCGSRAHCGSGRPQRSGPHVERIDRIRRNRPGKRRPRRRAHTQRGIPWHGHTLARAFSRSKARFAFACFRPTRTTRSIRRFGNAKFAGHGTIVAP